MTSWRHGLLGGRPEQGALIRMNSQIHASIWGAPLLAPTQQMRRIITMDIPALDYPRRGCDRSIAAAAPRVRLQADARSPSRRRVARFEPSLERHVPSVACTARPRVHASTPAPSSREPRDEAAVSVRCSGRGWRHCDTRCCLLYALGGYDGSSELSACEVPVGHGPVV